MPSQIPLARSNVSIDWCVQVAEINTPEVRLLPDGEIMQREATVAAFRCHLKSQGQVQMPDELHEVLRGQPGEGSSSEDTSDEAYATRHRPFEDEERQRFLGVSGGERSTYLDVLAHAGFLCWRLFLRLVIALLQCGLRLCSWTVCDASCVLQEFCMQLVWLTCAGKVFVMHRVSHKNLNATQAEPRSATWTTKAKACKHRMESCSATRAL